LFLRRRYIMCNCVNVEMGSYDNQIVVPAPFWMVSRDGDHIRDFIGIDKCLYDEIVALWQIGVTTVESCCGHNVPGVEAYIAVLPKNIDKMIELGYKKINDKPLGCFYPQTEYDKIVPVEHNEWIKPDMVGFIAECCDCGLQHEVDFKIATVVHKGFVSDIENDNLVVLLRARRVERKAEQARTNEAELGV
jgi:hypothetical protein